LLTISKSSEEPLSDVEESLMPKNITIDFSSF
jgi:hypothetical protein